MPNFPDFPKDEYQQRYARARALMDEHNLDGLLITEELNYIYFTGHRSQQNPIDKIRPYVFVLPKNGDGALITMPFEVAQVRETTWVEDIRHGTLGVGGHRDAIVEVLKDKGLTRGRIGAELGREQYLGISYNQFEGIRKALPGAEFVDAAPVLLPLRGTKSPREVAYMRRAAEITATAIAETFDAVHGGMTHLEVMRVLRELMAHHGGEKAQFVCVTAGVYPGPGIVSVATQRKLQPGDILILDTGVEYFGYCTDVARCASVGEPSAEVAEFYAWMGDLRHHCIDLLKAGTQPRQVVAACRQFIAERGLETTGVGRIGHGVGLEATEYPSLASDEVETLRSGMTLTCNPNFVRDFGFINAEDVWLITEGAPQLLSAPMAQRAEMPIVRVK